MGVAAVSRSFRGVAIAQACGDAGSELIGLSEVVGRIVEEVVYHADGLRPDDVVVAILVCGCEHGMCEPSLKSPMVVQLVEGKVLPTFFGSGYGCDSWARGVFGCTLDYQVFCDLRIPNPNVHLAIGGKAKDPVILVGELVHSLPWRKCIHTVDATKEWYG